MRKEVITCRVLKKWFEGYGLKCWMNEGHNKFTTKLSQKKPDLIIYAPLNNQYIAIEVKNGDNSREVYNASKIIEYWEEYKNNNIQYFINDQQIKIDSFCVATHYSQFGKLFYDDSKIVSIEQCKDDNWKYISKLKGLEPKNEYLKSSIYLRFLWSEWRKKRKREPAPGIGIILSNTLNLEKVSEEINRPLLFDMQWEEQINKHKWQNRQKVLQ
jgi:hypothetical protein